MDKFLDLHKLKIMIMISYVSNDKHTAILSSYCDNKICNKKQYLTPHKIIKVKSF